MEPTHDLFNCVSPTEFKLAHPYAGSPCGTGKFEIIDGKIIIREITIKMGVWPEEHIKDLNRDMGSEYTYNWVFNRITNYFSHNCYLDKKNAPTLKKSLETEFSKLVDALPSDMRDELTDNIEKMIELIGEVEDEFDY